MADIQSRCESLQSWYQNAAEGIAAREAELEQFAQTLATQHEQQSQEAWRLLETQSKLEADQAQLQDGQADLQGELTKLQEAQERLGAAQQHVAQLRDDLDTEWESCTALRKANEQLGQELDAERQRLNRDAFDFAKAARQAA